MTDSTFPATTPPASVWRRRRWLAGALAAAAAVGGGGLAWWQTNRSKKVDATLGADFWQLNFVTPDGAPLPMAAFRGKPLLLNFWATWCPPCVEELPLLSRFYQANSAKGWQVLALAVDQIGPVQRFLAQAPVAFPVALAGLPGIELSRKLGNAAGSLPFTTALGLDGSIRHRKIGQVSADDLLLWTSET